MLLFCLDSAQDKPNEALLKAARIGDLQTVSTHVILVSILTQYQDFGSLHSMI